MSAIGVGVSTASTRDTANEPKLAEPMTSPPAILIADMPLDADLEIDRAGEGVGDRRPFLHMGDQRADLLGRNALTFHVDLDAHVGEADRLLGDVAGAPDCGDVEIALELQLE